PPSTLSSTWFFTLYPTASSTSGASLLATSPGKEAVASKKERPVMNIKGSSVCLRDGSWLLQRPCLGRARASGGARPSPMSISLPFAYRLCRITAMDRWLGRLQHDLVKRLLWPARDR